MMKTHTPSTRTKAAVVSRWTYILLWAGAWLLPLLLLSTLHIVRTVGGCMEPTISDGALCVSVDVRPEQLHRGEIVTAQVTYSQFPDRPARTQTVLKRLVGLPGDVLEIRDGQFYCNGELQPTYRPGLLHDTDMAPLVVEEGCCFLMGDNRNISYDSRYFGCVPLDQVESHRVISLLPADHSAHVEEGGDLS